MRNIYTELGFGMQADVNFNSDDSSHQIVMDMMTTRPRHLMGWVKDGKLRIYMDLRLITSTQQATTKTSIISGNCAICMPTLSINIQVIVGVAY